jgi:hypothetical protein
MLLLHSGSGRTPALAEATQRCAIVPTTLTIPARATALLHAMRLEARARRSAPVLVAIDLNRDVEDCV